MSAHDDLSDHASMTMDAVVIEAVRRIAALPEGDRLTLLAMLRCHHEFAQIECAGDIQ